MLLNKSKKSVKKVTIRKRTINVDSIQEFRDVLSEVDWANLLYSVSNSNDAYEYFLKVFSGTILHSLSKLSWLKEKLCKIQG